MPTVRFGGGVWKHQEDVRADLERRLAVSDGKLHEAVVEIDRVHAQCVRLLRDKNELAASLHETQMQRRHQAEELHAAKQNVTELMTLLTQANEARTRAENERSVVTTRWHQARDHEQQTRQDAEELRFQKEDLEQEARRLRDLLYAVQEESECQQHEIVRQQKRLAVLVHSNDAKDRQIINLIRERDALAQKLAQYRSRTIMESTPLTSQTPTPPQPQEVVNGSDDSCERVTWTEISPGKRVPSPVGDASIVEFEQQKQRLREVAMLTKSRLEKEREQNVLLLKRIEALEKSQQEMLVRYRASTKARPRRSSTIGPSAKHCKDTSTSLEGPVQAA